MNPISRRAFLFFAGMGSASLLARGLEGKLHSSKEPAESGPNLSSDPWIELHLDRMTWNLGQIKKTARVKVMAVIKANAYGHGLVEVGKHLEKADIDFLMAGKLQEALLLRENGVSPPLLNFGPFSRTDTEKIIRHEISQSVFDGKVKDLSDAAIKLGKKARVHIHVDTGMGRMGISFREAWPFIRSTAALRGILIEGISTALTEDDDFDREQINRFLSLCQKAAKNDISVGLRHAASSDGVLDLPSAHLDMVRPGITLYGYYPSEKTQEEDRLSLKPVLELKSRVVDVKALRPGDSVSYHRKYTARKKEQIAIIPIGYSDGYPPNVVGKASVLIQGKRHPLIAAVTANHCTALLEQHSTISTGNEVVLLGSQGDEKITADEIAGWAGVSAYKILIGLSPLLPRIVIKD